MLNKDVIIAISILFSVQIVIWYQLNGQLAYGWFKDHPWLLSLLGVPISYALILTTEYGYRGFGEQLWPVRLMGFAVGMISFPFITYFMLGEGITIKTGISIALACVIMIIQLFW
tara:strand:+ start:1279 stop:1623 length:345 start_codon:yes stop_codon:yes gene_type:complete